MIRVSRTYSYLSILILTVFVSGCTEKINLDLEVMEPTPVITGILSNEEQWVRLNTTSAYLNGDGTPISGAEVMVSDGVSSFLMLESITEKGLYEFSNEVLIKPDVEYTLNVRADFNGSGMQEYTASSLVAPTPKLDSITIQVIRSFDELIWFVQINYQEISESNNYLCRTYVNDTLDVGLSSYDVFDNRYMKGEYMKHKIVAVLFERPFSEDKIQVDDVVRVSFSGITKAYFDFLYSAIQETEGGNPIFSGPPANVKGNISNGALGFFSAYIATSLSVVIMEV